MKATNFFATIAIAFGMITLITSCNSENSLASTQALSTTATEESQAANVSNEVISCADDYTPSFPAAQMVKGFAKADSVKVTVDQPDATSYPKVITIDFGTTGFTAKRGNVLKGKLIVTINKQMHLAGSSRVFTFVDFSVNGNALTGSKIVTYKGIEAEKHSLSIVANDTITRTDGKKVIWISNRTRTLIDNNMTPLIFWDDTYSITGSSNGKNANGKEYSMIIDDNNPLIFHADYPHFTKGTVSITTENNAAVIDYGDGTKDAQATYTINFVTKEFTLNK